MNEENLAESDNSVEEPQTDNQDQLLSLKAEAEETTEPEAMPHLASEDQQEEPVEWGDRPDWMPETHWSPKDGPEIEGMATELATVNKDYKELRTKMSQGLHKAPKDGNYESTVLAEAGVTEDDPLLTGFLDVAKEHGISQDAFNEISNLVLAAAGEAQEDAETTVAQERAKLGRNAEKIIKETDQWLLKLGPGKNNSGVLDQSEMEALANASTNGHFISAMNKIRQSYNEQPMPGIDVMEGQAITRQELDSMVADPRYGVDMAFTSDVEQKVMQAYGEA